MADSRTVEIPADDVEALEFYAEDTGATFEEVAQLILSQGLAAYTQARVDAGQRYFAEPTS
jgi:hypothetical protein